MLSSDFQVYTQQILDFLKTVSVKYSPLASLMNDTLIRSGYPVDLGDPGTWKYYLNLMGEYHPTDTMMTVTSLDTLQTISFTKEVLANHPRTSAAYKPGTSYFVSLCERYPEQLSLIRSILFPATDLGKLLAADDISLVAYGDGYLEDTEQPALILGLKSFLSTIRQRWHFSFLQVEPYFAITFFADLYTKMAGFLLTERDNLIRTPYVHSWHIWQYLQSNGLDNYSDILDRKKSLFLYQNWEYLSANSGKQSNLLILIDALLSDLGIGICGRRVVQQTRDGAAQFQLTPQLEATVIASVNGEDSTAVAVETVADMQSRLYAEGLTLSENTETVNAVIRTLGDTTLNNFLTKFLEIRPVAADSRYADLLNIFILDTLVSTITSGLYNNSVAITDPLSGKTVIMSPKECLALYAYCTARSVGLILTKIPTKHILRFAYKNVYDPVGTTYPWNGKPRRISSWFNTQTFFGTVRYPPTITTADMFSETLSTLWLQAVGQLGSCEVEGDTFLYDLKQYLLSTCIDHYKEISFTLVDGFADYATWLGQNGINLAVLFFGAYDVSDNITTYYQNLADTIISALVPMTDILRFYGDFTLSDNGYARLRQLFIQLCSYNVRFLDSNRENTEYIILGKHTVSDFGGDMTSTGILRPILTDTGSALATYVDRAYTGTFVSPQIRRREEPVITEVSHGCFTATEIEEARVVITDKQNTFKGTASSMRVYVPDYSVGQVTTSPDTLAIGVCLQLT